MPLRAALTGSSTGFLLHIPLPRDSERRGVEHRTKIPGKWSVWGMAKDMADHLIFVEMFRKILRSWRLRGK